MIKQKNKKFSLEGEIRKNSKEKLFFFVFVLICSFILVNAITINNFSNGLSSENLSFSGNQNIIRYLDIGFPQVIDYSKIFLEGFITTNFTGTGQEQGFMRERNTFQQFNYQTYNPSPNASLIYRWVSGEENVGDPDSQSSKRNNLTFEIYTNDSFINFDYGYEGLVETNINFQNYTLNLSIYDYNSSQWVLLNSSGLPKFPFTNPYFQYVNVSRNLSLNSSLKRNNTIKLKIETYGLDNDPGEYTYSTNWRLCGGTGNFYSNLVFCYFNITTGVYPKNVSLNIGNNTNNFVSSSLMRHNNSIQLYFNDSNSYKESDFSISNSTYGIKIPKNSIVNFATFDTQGIQSSEGTVYNPYNSLTGGSIAVKITIDDSSTGELIDNANCQIIGISNPSEIYINNTNSSGIFFFGNFTNSEIFWYSCTKEGYSTTVSTFYTSGNRDIHISLTKIAPFNPRIQLNNSSGETLWNYSGLYVTHETSNNFSSILNNYLNTCTIDSSGYCTFNLFVSSENQQGILGVGNLRIEYSPFVYNAITDSNDYINATCETTCQVPYIFHSNVASNVSYYGLETSSNTCSYIGLGTWNINMSEHCNITSPANLQQNVLNFTGTGWVNVSSQITNISILGIPPANSILYLPQGGLIKYS